MVALLSVSVASNYRPEDTLGRQMMHNVGVKAG